MSQFTNLSVTAMINNEPVLILIEKENEDLVLSLIASISTNEALQVIKLDPVLYALHAPKFLKSNNGETPCT